MAHGSDLNAVHVAAFQDAVLATWPDDRAPPADCHAEGVWHWIERNHVCNTLLWRAEERARRSEAADAEVAGCKRSIDRHNQARHEALELIDAALLDLLGRPDADPGARLHSETPGAMIDRLSLLALHICHTKRTAERQGAGDPAARLDPRLKRLAAQRLDLCDCLDRLLRELADGEACFHLYGPLQIEPRPRHPAATT